MANGVSPNIPFRWTGERERAAVLCAEDAQSDREIADSLNIHPKTLASWKRHPDFQTRIAEEVDEIRKKALRFPIAKVTERVRTLNALRDDLFRVKEERAEEWAQLAQELDAKPETEKVFGEMFGGIGTSVPAGAGTGLVVRQIKMVGSGPTARIVEEFGIDTSLFDRIIKAQDEAARELGQRVDKQELSGQVSMVRIVGADVEAI